VNLNEIKNPKLRARILRTLNDADQLKHELKASCPLQSPQPEQALCDESLAEGEGKKEGARRIGVRFNCFRSRLLDPDNLCVKSLLDGLRYSGLLPGDEPDKIELTVTQEKCDKKDERTEIQLIY
jgi:hypothetical protein